MQVIGHRGAAALAPENTWESFDIALSLGVDAIETDVRATSDRKLILFHDDDLDRTTNGKGAPHLAPWSVINTLDAGSWFDKKFQGAKVPLLQESLLRYGNLTQLVVEIKQPGIELEVLKIVDELQLIGNVTFTSFEFEVAKRIKAEYPNAKVGYLTSDIRDENIRRVIDAKLDQFCPPANAVSPGLVQRWKNQGVEVRAWGVSNTEVMKKAIDAGVDGMTCDFPHILLEALGRKNGYSPERK